LKPGAGVVGNRDVRRGYDHKPSLRECFRLGEGKDMTPGSFKEKSGTNGGMPENKGGIPFPLTCRSVQVNAVRERGEEPGTATSARPRTRERKPGGPSRGLSKPFNVFARSPPRDRRDKNSLSLGERPREPAPTAVRTQQQRRDGRKDCGRGRRARETIADRRTHGGKEKTNAAGQRGARPTVTRNRSLTSFPLKEKRALREKDGEERPAGR